MRKNCIRENIQANFITVDHISGKLNLSDLFTKKDKHPEHFFQTRDQIMTQMPVESTPSADTTDSTNNTLLSQNFSLDSCPQNSSQGILSNNTVGRGGVSTTYVDVHLDSTAKPTSNLDSKG
mmetsp:Transcript_20445/g.28759  ORF Transcript_20445/g.28759 Transcript_20445/m.28759 type:complete len:122 (+) Transcript_20445:860-1225(+)